MSKFSKLKIKDSQMLSEVEMKNVIGGYGNFDACGDKKLGQDCYYYDHQYNMGMRVSGKCQRTYKPAGPDLICM